MALFGLFNTEKKENKVIPFQLTQDSPTPSVEKVTNESSVAEDATAEKKPLTVSYATGWPIDIIYGYLHKNYEKKGYDDAMLNSNLAFRDMNMNIIRHKILMVFREINLNYDAMKQDLDTRIETCNTAGLLTTAADLNKQMSVIKAHREELSQLENDFRSNANEASVPLMSYECGFLRGISTITMAGPMRKHNENTPLTPVLKPQNMTI